MDAEAVARRVREHVEAVGAVDVERLRGLYAEDARLYDPVGARPVVGREAVGRHFERWLTAPRLISSIRISVTGHDNSLAAVSFSAKPEGAEPVDIVDVMRFGQDLLIAEMTAFSVSGTST